MARAALEAEDLFLTTGMKKDLILNFTAGQRVPNAIVTIDVPAGVTVTMEHTFVNVIGRGEVPLGELSSQSPGRWGDGYHVTVGEASIEALENGEHRIRLSGLDLRPDNGIDVQLRIAGVSVDEEGIYTFEASYRILEPEELTSQVIPLEVRAVHTLTDFRRILDERMVYDRNTDYQSAEFTWTPARGASAVTLLHSLDRGRNWEVCRNFEGDTATGRVGVKKLTPDMEHWFCLSVTGGSNAGISNTAKLYSGMYRVRTEGGAPVDGSDAAGKINEAIAWLNTLGGGTVLFEGGDFHTTTIHLRSNVYLYIDKTAQLCALKGCDDPEETWYSDREYRCDRTPAGEGAYLTPENWMTKQDAGHSYWHNAMFFGQRLHNIKIIGNGRISGEHNLIKGNQVMEYESGKRADKMVSLKLCTNFEFGGLSKQKDLWYEETQKPNGDEPFYLESDGRTRDPDIDNMLRISSAGHFVLLATGGDGISTHDVYAEKSDGGIEVRDIFDFMSCSHVAAFNIYAGGAPDDIIKLGSDCSLGFTRPAGDYMVRNIIGDTACNLFQIGSETADDIQDVCVDNIYVLAAGKAGFSISVNDGGTVKNIHLNCGGTAGKCRYGLAHKPGGLDWNPPVARPFRSKMRRARTPFFISLSNRGRTLGARMARWQSELIVENIHVGRLEDIFLHDIDAREIYGESQAKQPPGSRWPCYRDQARTTPIIAGYQAPASQDDPLPEKGVSYIKNVRVSGIDILVKGGNPLEDAYNSPEELKAGQFNLRNMAGDERASRIPAYGYYVRHVKGFHMTGCSAGFEENDDRYAVVLDDVEDAYLERITVQKSENNQEVFRFRRCRNVNDNSH